MASMAEAGWQTSSRAISVPFHAGVQLGEMPSAALLGSLSEFEANPAVAQQQENLAASLVAADATSPTMVPKAAGSGARSTVVLGTGLPSLPKKIVDKIVAGEYVDFAKLPPARGKARAVPQALEGQIVVIQAADLLQSRRVIPDLATWLQCYAIFAAVIATKNPDRLPDLMAYMSIIAKASQKFAWPSWVVYDQNFRQEAACTANIQWARVDPSIYTQCFTGMAIGAEGWCRLCQSIEHSSETCPLAPKQVEHATGGPQGRASLFRKRAGQTSTAGPPKRAVLATPQDHCIKYNRFNGDCKFGSACRYPHVCSTCKGPHPVSKCEGKRGEILEAK